MGLYYTDTPSVRKRRNPRPLSRTAPGVLLLCGYYNTKRCAPHVPMIADSIWILTGEKQFEGTEVSARMNTVAQVTPAYPPAFLAVGSGPLPVAGAELIVALAKNGVESSPTAGVQGGVAGHEFQIQLDTAAGKEACARNAVSRGSREGFLNSISVSKQQTRPRGLRSLVFCTPYLQQNRVVLEQLEQAQQPVERQRYA